MHGEEKNSHDHISYGNQPFVGLALTLADPVDFSSWPIFSVDVVSLLMPAVVSREFVLKTIVATEAKVIHLEMMPINTNVYMYAPICSILSVQYG